MPQAVEKWQVVVASFRLVHVLRVGGSIVSLTAVAVPGREAPPGMGLSSPVQWVCSLGTSLRLVEAGRLKSDVAGV